MSRVCLQSICVLAYTYTWTRCEVRSCTLARLLLWGERMIVLAGTYCFGTVLGWVAAFMIHHGRPGWREVKAALGVLFGAALQAVFGKGFGIVVYGVGVAIGAVLYVVTLFFRPLRRAHNIAEG